MVAVELGATGVGIIGILSTSVILASTALGGGLGGSGVRAVAAAMEGDHRRRDSVMVALSRGTLSFAVLAAALAGIAWLAWGALLVPQVPTSVLAPWVALSVGATIGFAGNSARLNGVGRIYALAVSTGLGAVTGTLALVVAMRCSDRWGLIAAFVAVPTATWAVSAIMVRSGSVGRSRPARQAWLPELRGMLMLGLAFSSSVILTSATQLIARVWVSHRLDITNAGYLQGCLAIASVYLGFVLNGLGAEYYPRISALHGDRELSNRAVNVQVRLVLTLAIPVILWMIVAAPVLLRVLYNREFEAADGLLRLLLVGDIFKLVGWCIGFLLLAREAKIKFFLAELSWNVVFLAVLLPAAGQGLEVAGFAYAAAYLLYAFASLALANRETSFVVTRGNRRLLVSVSVAVITTLVAAESSSELGLPLAVLVAGACTAVAAWRLLAWTRLSQEGAP
jgi:PST family polysaccharide transporter